MSDPTTTPSKTPYSSTEKDIEAGLNGGIAPTSSSTSLASEYDEGIMRVTSLQDPEKNADIVGGALGATKTLSKTITRRTQKDLEAVLNTQFEVKWESGDPTYPQNWPFLHKAAILCLVSLQTLAVVLYSTSYVAGSAGMMKEFGIDNSTTVTAGLTCYLLGLACGPLILAPMSELYGRKPIYRISLVLFFIFVIPACVAQNFATILIVRFIGAFVGSVTISNAPGTLGDIFNEDQRTLAFSLFATAPMNGPVLGPIIGGFVYQSLGWRWTNWIILIISGVLTVLAFFQPETYGPVLLRKRAEKLRRETGDERYMSRFCYKDNEGDLLPLLKVNLKRPLVMLFTEPMCIFWAIYIAVVYGLLYLCFTAYPVVFSEIRGWSTGISGLAFLGIGGGTLVAIAMEPLSRKIYNMHKIDPDTGKRPPEARIVLVCFAAVITPISVLWFAWTCYPISIHWIWPILSGIPYGAANTFVFLHGNTYLVTSYDVYAASAMAGNTVTRSILGGVLPLFGPAMYHKLGPNWAASLVALLSAILIPIPIGFYFWGKKIRMRSPLLLRLQRERIERGE